MEYLMTFIQHINVLPVSLLIIIAIIAFVFYKAQKAKDNFDLRDIFVDQDTGKVTIHKFGIFVALILTSWVFVYLTIHGTLTETFYLTYLAVWTGYSGMIGGISAYRSVKSNSSTDTK